MWFSVFVSFKSYRRSGIIFSFFHIYTRQVLAVSELFAASLAELILGTAYI